MRNFALKGNIIFTPQKNELKTFPDSYVICCQNTCEGVYPELPDEYKNIRVIDFGDALIIPGMVDLHIHAPQYAFRGTGMDCELLGWLKLYTFPEEAKYSDTDYAARAYGIFADNMKRSATTRAVIFRTVHREATLLLMDLMEVAGIVSYVGSDVAGGQTESIFRAITDAVQVSKLYWRYFDSSAKPLSFAESFYLATKGGGSFFGNAGSFEAGFEFDAVVISKHPHAIRYALR